MTSAVIRSTPSLSFITRSACSSSRVTSRKLPAVVRLIAAMASVVMASGMSRPRWAKAVVRTVASSPAARVRVVVDEADAAVEPGIAGQAFFDAGHADEDQPQIAAVVAVADLLKGAGGEPFGLIDDDEFGVEAGAVEVGLALGVVDVAGADNGVAVGQVGQVREGPAGQGVDQRRVENGVPVGPVGADVEPSSAMAMSAAGPGTLVSTGIWSLSVRSPMPRSVSSWARLRHSRMLRPSRSKVTTVIR